MRTDLAMLSAGVVSSGLLLAGGASAQDISAPMSRHSEAVDPLTNPLGENLPEARLSNRVEAALLADLKGPDALRISVSCYGSSATLSGEVRGRNTERVAAEVARRVPGVNAIHSVMVVNPKLALLGNIESRRHDARMAAQLRGLLLKELGTAALRVHVVALDGAMEISGPVPHEAQRAAVLKTALAMPGVRLVEDQMHTGR